MPCPSNVLPMVCWLGKLPVMLPTRICWTMEGRRGSVPPGAVQTWGPAFSEFAFSIGLSLDAGQKDILNDGLSTRADGLWLAREVDDIEPRQNGKSLLFEIRALGGVYLLKEPLVIWTGSGPA